MFLILHQVLGLCLLKSMLVSSENTSNYDIMEITKSLVVPIRSSGRCSGTLISARWILSAAHCFQADKQFGSAVSGNGDVEIDPKVAPVLSKIHTSFGTLRIDKIILKGQFESEAFSWKGHDLALIKLEKSDLTESKNFSLICLPAKGNEPDHKSPIFMGGFGRKYVPHCLTDR